MKIIRMAALFWEPIRTRRFQKDLHVSSCILIGYSYAEIIHYVTKNLESPKTQGGAVLGANKNT